MHEHCQAGLQLGSCISLLTDAMLLQCILIYLHATHFKMKLYTKLKNSNIFVLFSMQRFCALVPGAVPKPLLLKVPSEFRQLYSDSTLKTEDILSFARQIASGMVSMLQHTHGTMTTYHHQVHAKSQFSFTSYSRSSWPT